MGKKPEQTWPMPPVPTPWLAISGGSSSDAILLVDRSKPGGRPAQPGVHFFFLRSSSHVALIGDKAAEDPGRWRSWVVFDLRSAVFTGFEANQANTATGGQGAPERDQGGVGRGTSEAPPCGLVERREERP